MAHSIGQAIGNSLPFGGLGQAFSSGNGPAALFGGLSQGLGNIGGGLQNALQGGMGALGSLFGGGGGMPPMGGLFAALTGNQGGGGGGMDPRRAMQPSWLNGTPPPGGWRKGYPGLNQIANSGGRWSNQAQNLLNKLQGGPVGNTQPGPVGNTQPGGNFAAAQPGPQPLPRQRPPLKKPIPGSFPGGPTPQPKWMNEYFT